MHDIRYALRLIRQNWGFSLTVIAILALCIGANTAVLSVVDVAMVRPVPFPQPERLGYIAARSPGDADNSVDGFTWQLIRDRVPALETAVEGAGFGSGINMTVNNTGVLVQQGRVSAGYFHVLGIVPEAGREFNADEDRPGGPAAVMLSYSSWQKYFHDDRSAIGATVLLRGEPHTVIGILPRDYVWGAETDVWTPLRPTLDGEGGGTNYGMIARVRSGATLAQAQGQLALLTEEVRKRGIYGRDFERMDLIGLLEGVTQDLRGPLQILWIAVAAVFLLGCVNIGGMMLARSSGRVGEIATRLALGAPLSRVVRQLIIESVVLSWFGGVAGAGVGWFGLKALQQLGSKTFSYLQFAEFDWRIVAATFALTLFAGLLFGLAPAFQAARVDLRSAQSGSRTVAGRKRFISLGALVGGQVALAVPLLIGAGLLLHTFVYLWNLPPGFDSNHVVTARFSMQDARYPNSPKINQFFDRVIENLHQIPGVEAAAVSLTLPYERALNTGVILPSQSRSQTTNFVYVTPEYFTALRVPIRAGRNFNAGDGATAPHVVVVNEAFVNRYLKGQAAVGQMIRLSGDQTEIVGVVANIQEKRAGWGNFGPVGQVPTVFGPAAQVNDKLMTLVHTWFSPSWIVRTSLPDRDAIAAVEQATHRADPVMPPAEFRTFDQLKTSALQQERFMAALVDVLGGLAILLTTLGIYGLIANLASERTKELGIRLALGSSASAAVSIALRPALTWVIGGIVLGAAASIAVERFLKSFLYGVQPGDPATMVAVAGGLLLAAAIASLIPALRILRLNPADTLRSE